MAPPHTVTCFFNFILSFYENSIAASTDVKKKNSTMYNLDDRVEKKWKSFNVQVAPEGQALSARLRVYPSAYPQSSNLKSRGQDSGQQQ